MLGKLFGRESSDGTDEAGDARLAVAVLMVRVAHSDWTYTDDEARRIDAILGARYDLTVLQSEELRLEAEVIEAEATDTVRFTREIKQAVDLEDRDMIIEILWELVLSDGVRDDREDSVLRLVAPLLGINDRDSALARQRAEKRLMPQSGA